MIYEVKSAILNSCATIKLCWIPSHVGITGDEQADTLAKEAIRTGSYVNFQLPYSDIKELLNEEYKKSHFDYLDNTDTHKGIHYFKNYYLKSMKTWYHNFNYTRRHITTIIRLRTNHYSLNESLFRKTFIQSPECACGALSETIEHFLWECPQYQEERKWLIDSLEKANYSKPLNSIHILNEPKSHFSNILIQFIIKCKRNI